ncbi:MAG TPA: LamG domain-containing protein [Gammaproteobacteria bacterium]|nr:LamG domain-containing protein [Gammaproteobacteria bacterium]
MQYASLMSVESPGVGATKRGRSLPTRLAGGGAVLVAAMLAACSGGSGADVEETPGQPVDVTSSNYNGPPPSTADVQSFKINLWDNVQANNRCGTCHSDTGGQAPMFARRDDINLAYAAANGVVTLASPQDSQMVAKVGGGHNCWLASDAACGDILTTWITNWAGSTASTAARKIELEPPVLRDPGQSKNFPPDQGALFSTTVYPILEQHCSECHASNTALKQQPFFAEGPPSDSDAVELAYEAAKPKMNLDDPAISRLVVRLRNESHNCWTSSCTNDANVMETAIQNFSNNVTPTSVDPSLVTSKATTLYEGTIASGGNRYEANVIAMYEFKTGQDCGTSITGVCSLAYDTSGVDPAMDLTLSGNVQWFGGWGLNFAGGKAQASTSSSAKLKNLILSTGEYSIEAWVAPGNVVQEDMRIVSYSASLTNRNFNLGQTMYDYDFFTRSSVSSANGDPALSTPSADEVLQATLQHVVATFHPATGRRIYVNGVLVATDAAPGGTITNWDTSYAFVLGNEVSGNRMWNGVIRLVAIHNRALTQAQIQQNFDAGVGEKFFLMFGVEHLTNINDSFIVVEAAQFDSYGYLFRTPFFISLDGTAQPAGLNIRGMRVGLNGAEAHVGQAFANLDTQISGTVYTPGTGQTLLNLGTVLPLEKGPDEDEFFLTFDTLGANTYSRPPPAVPPAPTPEDLPPASAIGVRTFDEISASIATLTGVSQNDPGVRAAVDEVRQSLPAVPSLEAYLSSHQAAVGQLAVEYCHALIEDPALRAATFPGFNFTTTPAAAFANENALFDPLLDRTLGLVQLGHQPDKNAVRTELSRLVNGYPDDAGLSGVVRPGLLNALPPGQANDEQRTRAIAKAVCASVVGSAAMLIQ